MRKTVKLADLLERVNGRNSKSTCSADARRGWNDLLECVLHDCDAYMGFRYLEEHEVPAGEEPGIRRPADNVKVEFPDDTRRHYFKDSRL